MKFLSGKIVFIMVFIFLVPLLLSGCGKNADNDKIVAKINNYNMTVGDFKSELDTVFVNEKGTLSNEDILDLAIKREILVQAAQREGMDKEKDFMRTIERYWKQTLYKELINKKIKELEADKSLTPKEKNKQIDNWYNTLKKKARIKKYNRVLEGIK